MKIVITSKSKIINPVDNPDNIYQFEGNFNENMFTNLNSEQYQYLKTQTKNYQDLNNVLNTMN